MMKDFCLPSDDIQIYVWDRDDAWFYPETVNLSDCDIHFTHSRPSRFYKHWNREKLQWTGIKYRHSRFGTVAKATHYHSFRYHSKCPACACSEFTLEVNMHHCSGTEETVLRCAECGKFTASIRIVGAFRPLGEHPDGIEGGKPDKSIWDVRA